jgi:hypothetical protein
LSSRARHRRRSFQSIVRVMPELLSRADRFSYLCRAQ